MLQGSQGHLNPNNPFSRNNSRNDLLHRTIESKQNLMKKLSMNSSLLELDKLSNQELKPEAALINYKGNIGSMLSLDLKDNP